MCELAAQVANVELMQIMQLTSFRTQNTDGLIFRNKFRNALHTSSAPLKTVGESDVMRMKPAEQLRTISTRFEVPTMKSPKLPNTLPIKE